MTKVLAYTAPIETAPKDKDVVVFNHTVKRIYQVVGRFDETWGGGRGAWFSATGAALTPKTWSPRLTEFEESKRQAARKAEKARKARQAKRNAA